MTGGPPFQGSLFAEDFLRDSIGTLDDWQAIPDSVIDELGTDLRKIFDNLPTNHSPNESQTEDDLIWPVLDQLGWTQNLKQQNLSFRRREDVPDGLLFTDAAAKQRANQVAEEWARYEHGEMVVESKRWLLPLDRQSRGGEMSPPSTQMLRYLRRIDDLTTGKLRWGILTNGAHWRLYYAGARSVSEQFFEIDLAAVLDLPGHNDGLFALPTDARRHWLKVFALVFRREAFVSGPTDGQTFHQRAIAEARFYQERVAANLSDLVFRQVFPDLARALAAAQAPRQRRRAGGGCRARGAFRGAAAKRAGAHRKRAFSELAGRVPGRLAGLGENRAARRLRCGDRQSALGPDEASAG